MSLYAIADLHLSLNEKTNKPMNVFGRRWDSHKEKLEKTWKLLINEDDTVVIPGDISWALTLEEAEKDLKFISSLPGKKIIGKGNHDFWWSTLTKINGAFREWSIDNISILHNNAIECEDFIIAGTRGWFNDGSLNIPAGTDYNKLVNREAQRLKISLDQAKVLKESTNKEILLFLHFPPVWNDFVCRPLIDLIHEYDITRCYFGHIHGNYIVPRSTEFENVRFTLISSDYLNFAPLPIFTD